MLFHQSAAEETNKVRYKELHEQNLKKKKKKEPGRTCAIPVRKVVRSLRALLPASRGQVKSWRQRREIFRLNDNKENTHLFFQSNAQTTATMKAVTTMNNTGTRTAVSATSDSKDTPVNTRWSGIKTAFLNYLTHLCWCGGAWWCFLCPACVWFGRGEAGVWSLRGVECDERGWSSWDPASLPKQKQKKPNLNLKASDAHTCLFICCINELRLYVCVCVFTRDLAAEQLQLERDPLVPCGGIYPHVAGFDGRDEVIPHLVQVVDIALEDLVIYTGEQTRLSPATDYNPAVGQSCSILEESSPDWTVNNYTINLYKLIILQLGEPVTASLHNKSLCRKQLVDSSSSFTTWPHNPYPFIIKAWALNSNHRLLLFPAINISLVDTSCYGHSPTACPCSFLKWHFCPFALIWRRRKKNEKHKSRWRKH